MFGVCVVFVWFSVSVLFLVPFALFACLISFTDWCTAHRQQFREQKKPKVGSVKTLAPRVLEHQTVRPSVASAESPT